MLFQVHGQAQFGADAVGAGYQHGLFIACGKLAEGAEAAETGHDFRATSAFGYAFNTFNQGVARIDINAGVFVA